MRDKRLREAFVGLVRDLGYCADLNFYGTVTRAERSDATIPVSAAGRIARLERKLCALANHLGVQFEDVPAQGPVIAVRPREGTRAARQRPRK